MVLSSFLSFSTLNIVYASDSLETILSHLSTRVMNVIGNGICLQHLELLLEFLAAWEKRPACLTPMAYQWCSAISEAAGRLGLGELPVDQPPIQQLLSFPHQLMIRIGLQLRLRPQDVAHPNNREFAEEEFSTVGPGCNPANMENTFNHTHICPQALIPFHYARLLPVILEIGFRLIGPGHDVSALRLSHTSHHWQVFGVGFSSYDDEVIADTVSAWIVDGDSAPDGLFMHYFTKRVERSAPFSPRLRQASIHAIESIMHNVPEVSTLESIHLLNHLNVDVGDMMDKRVWVRLLAGVMCLPVGLESLSPHYWCLLDKLPLAAAFSGTLGLQSVEVMRSLEEAEDWEKLEIWMAVVWQSLPYSTPTPMMEEVEQVSLKLLLQQPPALLRFETLCVQGSLYDSHKTKLQAICDQAQMEQLPLESPPSLYVFVHPTLYLPNLIPPYSSLQSIDPYPTNCSPSFYGR